MSTVVYFPTIKGLPHLERLHRYGHRAMAILLEADPDVLSWTTETDGWAHIMPGDFMPTFLVTGRSGLLAVRVIRAGKLDDGRLERYGEVARHLAACDIRFELHVERDVDADPRLPIARDILRLRSWPVPTDLLARAASASGRRRPSTLGGMHQFLGGDEAAWRDTLALVGHGHLDVGLPKVLDADVAIRAIRLGGVP